MQSDIKDRECKSRLQSKSEREKISQSSLGRIMAQENLPSLITLEKICTALGVTLSQFFQEGNSENLTEKTEKSSRDMERSEYK